MYLETVDLSTVMIFDIGQSNKINDSNGQPMGMKYWWPAASLSILKFVLSMCSLAMAASRFFLSPEVIMLQGMSRLKGEKTDRSP